MVKSCSTCARHIGLGACADGRETICKGELWQPITVQATPVDASRYVEWIDYHGDGVHITRRPDGRYDLRLEGVE